MKTSMATVSARKGGSHAPASRKHHTHRVEITPSANGGFSIDHHMANDNDGDEGGMNGRYQPPPPTETTVHPNWAQAKKHLSSIFQPAAAAPAQMAAAAPPAAPADNDGDEE